MTSTPTRWKSLIFHTKASGLRWKRFIQEQLAPTVQKGSLSDSLTKYPVLSESRTPLWTSKVPEEFELQAGKVENLRVAAQLLHGREFQPNMVFSFWKHIGKPTSHRGFVPGRELREGCIIPSIGGGLCQLSNALFSAALDAGFEILERHAHTQRIPGSFASRDRDATVFWNYVDLRFRHTASFRIEVVLTSTELVLRFRGKQTQKTLNITPLKETMSESPVNSCETCGVESCFRVRKGPPLGSKTAFLVDDSWPEFDQYIQSQRQQGDILCVPLSSRFGKANYAWSEQGFSQVHEAKRATLIRSLGSRYLSNHGPQRQKLLLKMAQLIAQSYAKKLTPNTTRLVISQSLLPYLWNFGVLGGREYEVLMTRMPIFALQKRLDWAFEKHPQSQTLGDFRTSPELVQTEKQALFGAKKLITPHTEIASIFGEKATLLPWSRPSRQVAQKQEERRLALFVGPTAGRKGAYLLKEVFQTMPIPTIALGNNLEEENFWSGLPVEQRSFNNWHQEPEWSKIRLVILPSYIEHCPRVALTAISKNIPVLATKACGLASIPEVIEFETGNIQELKNQLSAFFS